MKHFVTILLITLVGFTTQAQDKVAKIEFKTDVIDYGTIERGADGLRVFEFTNTGSAPLIITKVKASCGCTVPTKPEDPIMPGESGKIEVKYDTNRIFPFRKTITVTSNAETPNVSLKIKGNVFDPDAIGAENNK